MNSHSSEFHLVVGCAVIPYLVVVYVTPNRKRVYLRFNVVSELLVLAPRQTGEK